jgi:xanthine dehydrogenase accessory factor
MKHLIVVRGGGDIATGTIHRLHNAGYHVLVLEDKYPSAIRREVAFSEAAYDGVKIVERVTCRLAPTVHEVGKILKSGEVAMLVDPEADAIQNFRHEAVVDAILAKKNIGTTKNMADLTIALGPGFCAGRDVDWVIETMRGHNLGRIIREGFAMKNTGVPGIISGYGAERVIHAPAAGRMENRRSISTMVHKNEVIAQIYGNDGQISDVKASLDGILRGIIRDGYEVTRGLKIADIDPRPVANHCFTISDKARCIAGSVLELIAGHERGMWK